VLVVDIYLIAPDNKIAAKPHILVCALFLMDLSERGVMRGNGGGADSTCMGFGRLLHFFNKRTKAIKLEDFS